MYIIHFFTLTLVANMVSNSAVFYLAPLRGITDFIFRNTFEKYFGKFDFLLAPFTPTVKGLIVSPVIIKDIKPEKNDQKRLIPQIIGNNPSEILILANRMNEIGYSVINLNLGCPHTPVTRKKRGSGLLPYPDLVEEILQKIIPKLPCKLSVKLRLGLENEHEISSILPVLNQFPLAEIIIHPRTGAQMYTGTVNLDIFAQYHTLSTHPVVYNGDIFSIEDYSKITLRFPHLTHFMIGRGALQNPFLLQTLRTGKSIFSIETFHKFHDEIFMQNQEILSGPSHLLGKMKGLWSYCAINLPQGRKLLKKIQKTTSVTTYNRIINDYFTRI